MWTPKRILLLAAGFVVFTTLFFVYSFFLGGIDGIMPLPQEFWPGDGPIIPITDQPHRDNEAVKKLKIAFGPDSKEVKERTIKLTVPARHMVLATNIVEIIDEGKRVRITPFSVALEGKEKGDGSSPEINTVQADEAILTLDRPIANQFEMSSRKIVSAELRNNILIINNRGTPLSKSDDIEIFILKGPVNYEEKRHLIWTPDDVRLKDLNSKPEPTVITSRGMEVHLVQETPETQRQKEQAQAKKSQGLGGGESVSGVDKVVLLTEVNMHLWVDAGSGFMGPADKKKAAPPAAKPAAEPEKAHVVITTQGPFVYHAQKDLATFDSREPDPAKRATPEPKAVRRTRFDTADFVEVVRKTREGKSVFTDTLLCDHLELQFRAKARPETPLPVEVRPASSADKSGDRDIETALATARPGNEVLLTLDKDGVEAYGIKLHYTAGRGKDGARTVLSGSPLEVFKEGHKITAVEMVLVTANAQGEGQSAEARGPGEIYLFDKTKKENENQYPCHARWTDTLYLTKDKIGNKVYDLLILNTDAAFIDDDHKQELKGQRLQVWLEPGGGAPVAAVAPTGNDPQAGGVLSKQRPYKIEAQGQVRVESPELRIVRGCQNLIVVFQDDPQSLPDALPRAPTAGVENPRVVLRPTLPGPETPPAAPPPTNPTPAPAARTQEKAKEKEAPRPLDLGARTVRALVRRSASKSEIQTLFCEGGVTVHQDGNGPKDKGVNISGEMLQLDREPAGDKLQVFGDNRGKVAELQLGELVLIGPKVVIDQRDNTASVEGVGTMELPSNTSLEGGKAAKEGTRLNINWKQSMIFDGRVAYYQGGVVAYQIQPGSNDKSRLQCVRLQVTLDRDVSLKQGQKAGESAKVEKLVCDKQVDAQSTSYDEKGKMVHFHRLENGEMSVDNQQDMINAAGPGRVSILQYGAPDALGPQQPQQGKPGAAKPKEPDVLKLTRVLFQGRLWSQQKNGARMSKFFENVRVLHLPTDDPEAKVDQDRLPKNSFVMRSDYLEVLTWSAEQKNKGQYMVAKSSVQFRTPEFYGTADTLVYNEANETVLFQGTDGNPARVWRFRAPGARPEELIGRQIHYFRRTNTFQVVGGNRVQQ